MEGTGGEEGEETVVGMKNLKKKHIAAMLLVTL